MNYNLGSIIAFSGLVVAGLVHFGIGLDAAQVGQTITDIAKSVGDLAVIYGVFHQFFATKKVVGMVNAQVASSM